MMVRALIYLAEGPGFKARYFLISSICLPSKKWAPGVKLEVEWGEERKGSSESLFGCLQNDKNAVNERESAKRVFKASFVHFTSDHTIC